MGKNLNKPVLSKSGKEASPEYRSSIFWMHLYAFTPPVVMVAGGIIPELLTSWSVAESMANAVNVSILSIILTSFSFLAAGYARVEKHLDKPLESLGLEVAKTNSDKA